MPAASLVAPHAAANSVRGRAAFVWLRLSFFVFLFYKVLQCEVLQGLGTMNNVVDAGIYLLVGFELLAHLTHGFCQAYRPLTLFDDATGQTIALAGHHLQVYLEPLDLLLILHNIGTAETGFDERLYLIHVQLVGDSHADMNHEATQQVLQIVVYHKRNFIRR